MKKMIITGVNGFIGRCAMEYFSKDYEITGIDLADRYCEDGAEIHYYQCNMSKDSQELANIFTGVQPDVILHCAGSANVGASIVNPMADLDGNLHSLYQLLLALKSFEKRPKIHISNTQMNHISCPIFFIHGIPSATICVSTIHYIIKIILCFHIQSPRHIGYTVSFSF